MLEKADMHEENFFINEQPVGITNSSDIPASRDGRTHVLSNIGNTR